MKYLLTLLIAFSFSLLLKAQMDLTRTEFKTQNYIYSKTNNLKTAGGTDLVESIQYFDGLGRLIQTVNHKASPKQKDIIQPVEYDALGREATQYLPYSDTLSNASGYYRPGWKADQSKFYTDRFQATDGSKAFAYTMFENSPLNRVLKQGAPGAGWQPNTTSPDRQSSDYVTSYQYGSNTTETVYYWTLTGSYPDVTFTRIPYGVNTLYKTIITDENGNPLAEYKDKQGKVVMKKDALDKMTCYVYDDFDLLRCVIPPLAADSIKSVTKFSSTSGVFKELCYYYEYDHRHRMIRKKLPGTVGVYEMTYDNLDRLIETRDPEGIRIETRYDIFSRPIETRNKSFNYWITKTHYDSYTRNGIAYDAALPYVNHYSYARETQYKGKVTVTLSRVLSQTTGERDSLRTVYYYDKYGRLIQTVSENHKGGIDRVSHKYKYKNSDLVEETKTEHGIIGTTVSKTITETFTYDHAGRLTKTAHILAGQTQQPLSSRTYNELGQITMEKIG